MTKKIFIVLLFLSTLLPVYSSVHAQGFAEDLKKQTQAAAGSKGANLGTPQDPRAIAAHIIQIFLETIGILLVIYIVYGGALIFLSGGSEEKVNEGKAVIRRAVIGLIIIMSAYSITILVNSIIQNNDPCAPDENGNISCAVIKEDQRPYTSQNFDDTNPFTPYGGKVQPNGDRNLLAP